MDPCTADDQWSEIEKLDRSAIHEQKIRCVYLAEDASIPEGAAIGAGDVSHLNESVSAGVVTGKGKSSVTSVFGWS
jgi:hypothetical protein